MLEWMQKHRKYLVITVWISALALIFASMVEWGGGGFAAGSRDSVARVGDLKISYQEYQKAYYDIYNIIKQFYDMEEENNKMVPEIEQEAFRELVREKLLEVFAQDIGVQITPEEVLAKLLTIPEFQDNMQMFNKQQYLAVLEANNRRPDEYEAFVAKALLSEKMQNFPIFPLSSLEISTFLSAASIKDNIEVHLLDRKNVLDKWKPAPTEEQLYSYWESNKAKYFKPASYKVAYIALDIDSMQPTDENLQKFYNDNMSQYKGSVFNEIRDDIKQDYKKAIIRFASSYISNMSNNLVFKEGAKEDIIRQLSLDDFAILENGLIAGSDLTLDALPISFIEIKEDDKNIDFSILEHISKAENQELLGPLEYVTGKWFIPYVFKKVKQQSLDFTEAKDLASKDLVRQLEEQEFRKLVLSYVDSKNYKMTKIGFINMSDWHLKNTPPYHALIALGLHDGNIKQVVDEIMNNEKVKGVVFLDSERALLYNIIGQQMPHSNDLANVTNEEINALEEAKIRDLRNALIEYATNHYKIIDYRRQK